jgi:hypothetical protein
MVAAAYSLRLDLSELQGGAAVRAMQLQETHRAAPIAECHQLFPEDFDPVGKVVQFVGEADRLPKAAKILATRGAAANMCELCVFAGHLAMEVATKSGRRVIGSRSHSILPLFFNGRGKRDLRRRAQICAIWG